LTIRDQIFNLIITHGHLFSLCLSTWPDM